MDEDIKQMVHHTAFGNAIRSVEEFRKANEWKTWSNVLSPILLKGRLPEPFYSEWINLTTAITLATDYSVTTGDITKIRDAMAQFVVHYHKEYYKFENKRLSACKPVFHALLHVADCIEWMGPMWSYSQWVVERMFSLWVPKVKLRSSATRNLSLELFRDVLVHSLRYTTELPPTHPTPPPTAQAAIPLNEDDGRLTRPPSMDALLGKLRQLEMNGQLSPEVLKSRICSDEKHRGTLHHQAKQLQALTTRQIKHLDEYIASLGLQVEGAACPEVCI